MTTYTSKYKQTGLWYVDIKNEKWVESIETAIDKLNELITEHSPLVTLVQENAKLNIYKQRVDIYSKKTIVDDKFTIVSKNEEEVHRPDFVEGQIYIVLNADHTKAYFGQTLTYRGHGHNKYAPYGFEKRHKLRVYEAMESKKELTDTMSRAVKKYGPDNFQVYLVADCNILDLDFAETFFITHFDTTNPDKGYNILPGGKSYFKMGSKPSSNWKPNGDLISQSKIAKRLSSDIEDEYEYIDNHIGDIERIIVSTEKAYKGRQLRIEFRSNDSSKKACKSINFAVHESNKSNALERARDIIIAILSRKKLIVSFKQEDLREALNISEDLYQKHAKFVNLKAKTYTPEYKNAMSSVKISKVSIFATKYNMVRISYSSAPRINFSFGTGKNRNHVNIGGRSYTNDEIDKELESAMTAIVACNNAISINITAPELHSKFLILCKKLNIDNVVLSTSVIKMPNATKLPRKVSTKTEWKLPPKKGQAGKIEPATDEATDNMEPEDEQDYTD